MGAFPRIFPSSRESADCLRTMTEASFRDIQRERMRTMAIEQMLTEEMPASALVARVLEEAGIEMVFGISGGHTGRIVSGLSKYQNSIRTQFRGRFPSRLFALSHARRVCRSTAVQCPVADIGQCFLQDWSAPVRDVCW